MNNIIFTDEDLKNIGLKKEKNCYIMNRYTSDDIIEKSENYIKITLKSK